MLGAATQTKARSGWSARIGAAVRDLFFVPPRVQTATKLPDALRHLVADDESRVTERLGDGPGRVQGGRNSPGRGWPGRVPGLRDRVPGPETLVSQSADDDETPCIHMGAADLVNEFVEFMLGAIETRAEAMNHQRVLAQYWRWAREFRIHRIPDTIFLAQLGRHPDVKKGRDRVKDSRGRVVRIDTDARSPKRESVYIIGKKQRARRPLPGKVPVSEVVTASPVYTKPATRTPEPDQFELPMRRVA